MNTNIKWKVREAVSFSSRYLAAKYMSKLGYIKSQYSVVKADDGRYYITMIVNPGPKDKIILLPMYREDGGVL